MPSQKDERLFCPLKPIIKPLVKKHYDMLDKLILPVNANENAIRNDKSNDSKRRRTYTPIMKFLDQKLVKKRNTKSSAQL